MSTNASRRLLDEITKLKKEGYTPVSVAMTHEDFDGMIESCLHWLPAEAPGRRIYGLHVDIVPRFTFTVERHETKKIEVMR